jgi:predicted PurR-regulated permease PerM
MLSIGQAIILPLIFAALIATLLSPVIGYLVRKKMNRVAAISLSLIFALMVATGLIVLMGIQAGHFRHAWPALVDKCQAMIGQAVVAVAGIVHISTAKVTTWLSGTESEITKNSDAAIGKALLSAGSVVQAIVLTPVYIFMLLLYQPHLIAFSHRIFGAENDSKVSEILLETKLIIRSYIVGLFLEFVIIAVLNSIGLLALRIQYAILLGIVGAMLNVIPLIGGIVCVVLFLVITLLTKPAIYMLYVLSVYLAIQFIDDHYIFPKVVGSKVKLNLLASIISVILGAELWGVPGMFLAIPLLAIAKVVLDRIEALKPWGFLLGDIKSESEKIKFSFIIKGFIKNLSPKKNINI